MFRHLRFLILIVPVSGWSHHGIGNFDHNEDVNIEGVITDIAFINPHSWLYLDVQGPEGRVTPWRCELRAATMLRRSGWSPDMFAAGLRVRISGSPERSEPNTCYLNNMVLEDGTSLDRYGQITQGEPLQATTQIRRMADGSPDLTGDWAAEQVVMTDPRGKSGALLPLTVVQSLEDGQLPSGARPFPGSRGTPESFLEGPLEGREWQQFPDPVTPTELGRRVAGEFDPAEVVANMLTCEPDNILFDLSFEGHVNRITQTEDEVRMIYGFMDLERTIHLDIDEHPADLERTFAGHSIGRWDGDTLIVDTVGFRPGRITRTSNLMYGESFHVVERFILDESAMTITREYVAEDPLYFIGQFTGSDVLRPGDIAYQPYDCDDRTVE